MPANQTIRFKWNAQLGWFVGKARLRDGTKVEITCAADSAKASAGIQKAARVALDLIEKKLTTICGGAARRLLKLQNDEWNEGRERTTTDEFIECMTLEGVSLLDGGELELWFDDGNLFYGHSIVVELTRTGRVLDATVEG